MDREEGKESAVAVDTMRSGWTTGQGKWDREGLTVRGAGAGGGGGGKPVPTVG